MRQQRQKEATEAYFCCWDLAGCEPCRGWTDCGSAHSERPRAQGEARDLSFRKDLDETKDGERPTASPKRRREGKKCEAGLRRGLSEKERGRMIQRAVKRKSTDDLGAWAFANFHVFLEAIHSSWEDENELKRQEESGFRKNRQMTALTRKPFSIDSRWLSIWASELFI